MVRYDSGSSRSFLLTFKTVAAEHQHKSAFEQAEARRIAQRLELHCTPKDESWLNMAATEIGVMARQCLDHRIPDRSVLRREAATWQAQRNRNGIRVDWRFTTVDARLKLKSLYPSMRH